MGDYELIAYCGIRCAECHVYVATINNDHALAEKTAREWTESSGVPHRAEDMRCLGCKSDEVFRWCKECGVRGCAAGKERQTCGHCVGYKGCATIAEFLSHLPKEKAFLDAINHSTASRQEHWSIRRS